MGLKQVTHSTKTEATWIMDVLHRIPTHLNDPTPFLNSGIIWVNRWFAETVQPCIASLVRAVGEEDNAQFALAKAHQDAANGHMMSQADWHAILEPAFLQLFRLSYPYDYAFGIAYESAIAFAVENREMIDDAFGSSENYAQYYAELNTGRSQDFAALAQAHVHADLAAKALAAGSATLFAESWPHIRLRAVVEIAQKLTPFAPELDSIAKTLGADLANLADRGAGSTLTPVSIGKVT